MVVVVVVELEAMSVVFPPSINRINTQARRQPARGRQAGFKRRKREMHDFGKGERRAHSLGQRDLSSWAAARKRAKRSERNEERAPTCSCNTHELDILGRVTCAAEAAEAKAATESASAWQASDSHVAGPETDAYATRRAGDCSYGNLNRCDA